MKCAKMLLVLTAIFVYSACSGQDLPTKEQATTALKEVLPRSTIKNPNIRFADYFELISTKQIDSGEDNAGYPAYVVELKAQFRAKVNDPFLRMGRNQSDVQGIRVGKNYIFLVQVVFRKNLETWDAKRVFCATEQKQDGFCDMPQSLAEIRIAKVFT